MKGILPQKFNPRLLRRIGIISGIVLAVSANIYFRMSTFSYPEIDNTVRNDIYAAIKDKLEKDISVSYPGLWGNAKDRILSRAFRGYLEEYKADISRKIRERAKESKDFFRDDKGWPYLLEVDPYRWMRRIDNYLITGHFGTSQIDGKDYDDLVNAPIGREVEPLKIHYYLGAYFYRILHSLNRGLSLMNALSVYTLFTIVLLVLLLFVFCRLLGISYHASFLAVMTACLSEFFLSHSLVGWFDTDTYNVMFLPLTLAALGYALRKYDTAWRYFYISLAGVFIGIYSGLWSVWWLSFYVICAGIFVYLLTVIFGDKKKPLAKKIFLHAPFLLLFVATAYISVLLISGVEVFKKSFTDPFPLFFLRTSTSLSNFWPNVSGYIGEVGRPDFSEEVLRLGGALVIKGAILGLLGILIAKDYSKEPPEKRFLIHSLLIWLVAAAILTHFSRKFTLFLAVPVGVLFAKSWDWLVILSGKVTDGFKPPSIWSRKNSKALFLVPIFLYLVFNNLQYAEGVRMRGRFNIMHDGWINMLNKVKSLTPPDAIICTHWEMADYVMFFARRATFYCAAVQQTSVTYWISRALMTDNEKETAGILRMLASGSTRAFDELSLSLGGDNLKTMNLVNKMVLMDKSQAGQLLSRYIHNQGQREKILAFMYDARRPGYILLENGFLHTLKVESQVSAWDFKKAVFLGLSANNTGDNLSLFAQEQLGYSPQEAQYRAVLMHFLDKEDAWGWITKEGWRFSAFQEEKKQKLSGSTLLFDNGVIADLSKDKFYLYSNVNKKWFVPSYVIFYDSSNNKIKEYRDSEGDPESALFLVQEGQERYKTLLMSRKYAESVFFKMFFLKGAGLKYLKLLDHEHTKVYDKDLYLYEVIMS